MTGGFCGCFQVKNALNNVMDERDVLTMIHSRFVTNIKYSFQDEDYLYIVMDLMLGGDLKFHLINDGRFELERARFYAAEVSPSACSCVWTFSAVCTGSVGLGAPALPQYYLP